MSIADQEDNIIQFYRDVATQAQANGKEKAEPNAKSMSKAWRCLMVKGRGASSVQPKIQPMDYCVQSRIYRS
jgi:hypothetical protein